MFNTAIVNLHPRMTKLQKTLANLINGCIDVYGRPLRTVLDDVLTKHLSDKNISFIDTFLKYSWNKILKDKSIEYYLHFVIRQDGFKITFSLLTKDRDKYFYFKSNKNAFIDRITIEYDIESKPLTFKNEMNLNLSFILLYTKYWIDKTHLKNKDIDDWNNYAQYYKFNDCNVIKHHNKIEFIPGDSQS